MTKEQVDADVKQLTENRTTAKAQADMWLERLHKVDGALEYLNAVKARIDAEAAQAAQATPPAEQD